MQVCVPATPHLSVCPSIPHHNYLVSTHLFEIWGRGDGGEFGWFEDRQNPDGRGFSDCGVDVYGCVCMSLSITLEGKRLSRLLRTGTPSFPS